MMTGKKLKKEWMELPYEMFNTLCFSNLKKGDKFIVLPEPGDNSGHGGFKGTFYIYQKCVNRFSGLNRHNAVCLKNEARAHFPGFVLVLKVE